MKININSNTGGIILLVGGILVLTFPELLRFILGTTLIILGILALAKE